MHDGIFSDMIENIMEIFMDDFSIFGDSYEGYLENFKRLLERCVEKNLVLIGRSVTSCDASDCVRTCSVKGRNEVDKARVELISN